MRLLKSRDFILAENQIVIQIFDKKYVTWGGGGWYKNNEEMHEEGEFLLHMTYLLSR
jgi:hypothetical protein